jgi:hypothetical protein
MSSLGTFKNHTPVGIRGQRNGGLKCLQQFEEPAFQSQFLFLVLGNNCSTQKVHSMGT